MNVLLRMSSFIFPLITFPYISRVLEPVGTGKVSFAVSVVSYFNMFAQLGIPTYGIRACARVRDDPEQLTRTAQELLIINLVMSAVSYAVLFIVVSLVARLRQEKELYLIVSSTILLTAIGMEWMYQGLEQYTYIAVRSVCFKMAALIAMFLLVHSKDDYIVYGAISVFAAGGSFLLNFLCARKFISLKPVGNYDFRRHFRPIGIFFAMSVATTIYTQMDVTMVGLFKTDEEVGIYNAATRIKGALVSVVTSLGAVLLPRASYYAHENKMDQFNAISRKAMNFVFDMAVPCIVFFLVFSRETIMVLCGPLYEGSVMPMIILMPTILFIGITNIFGMEILVPLNHEKLVLHSEIAGTLVNLVLNCILIPFLGASGAAIGTMFAELAVLASQYISVNSAIQNLLLRIPYAKIFIASLAAGAASQTAKLLPLNDLLTILLGAVVYFLVYAAVLLLEKEPFAYEMMQDLKNRRRK